MKCFCWRLRWELGQEPVRASGHPDGWCSGRRRAATSHLASKIRNRSPSQPLPARDWHIGSWEHVFNRKCESNCPLSWLFHDDMRSSCSWYSLDLIIHDFLTLMIFMCKSGRNDLFTGKTTRCYVIQNDTGSVQSGRLSPEHTEAHGQWRRCWQLPQTKYPTASRNGHRSHCHWTRSRS